LEVEAVVGGRLLQARADGGRDRHLRLPFLASRLDQLPLSHGLAGSMMLRQRPGKQAEKATRLGDAQGTVTRCPSGASCPLSFVHRDACRRIFGIPLDSWTQPAAGASILCPARSMPHPRRRKGHTTGYPVTNKMASHHPLFTTEWMPGSYSHHEGRT